MEYQEEKLDRQGEDAVLVMINKYIFLTCSHI
jgi:hypothetical protein